MNKTKKYAFVLAATLFCILFLELILYVAASISDSVAYMLATDYPTISDDKLGYRPSSVHPEHDSKGFRNPRVPERADIICFGDSQTYGGGIPLQKTWPQLLAAKSGRSVYTFAFGGYGPAHSLVLLQEGLNFKPSLVIEALYSGNDLYDSFNLVYNQGSLVHLATPDASLKKQLMELEATDPIATRALTFMGFGDSPSRARLFLSKYSKLYGVIRALKRVQRSRSHQNTSLSSRWEKAKALATAHSSYLQVFEHENFRTLFTSQYRLIALNSNDPRIREGQRIALKAIEEINQRVTEAGSEFFVLLIPTKEFVFHEVVKSSRQDLHENYLELIEREHLFWEQTKSFLKELNIPYIDGVLGMRELIQQGRQPYPMFEDGHPNELGHEALAEQIAALLVGRTTASTPY